MSDVVLVQEFMRRCMDAALRQASPCVACAESEGPVVCFAIGEPCGCMAHPDCLKRMRTGDLKAHKDCSGCNVKKGFLLPGTEKRVVKKRRMPCSTPHPYLPNVYCIHPRGHLGHCFA